MASSVGDKQERHTSFTTNSSVNSSAGSNLNYEATADDIMKEDDIMVVVEDGIQNSPPQVRSQTILKSVQFPAPRLNSS